MDAAKPCGIQIIHNTTTIKSPNYPSNYGTSVRCVWLVQAPVKSHNNDELDNILQWTNPLSDKDTTSKGFLLKIYFEPAKDETTMAAFTDIAKSTTLTTRTDVVLVDTPYGGDRTNTAHVNTPYGGDRTNTAHVNTPYGGDRTNTAHVNTPYGGDRTNTAHVNTPYGGDRTNTAHVNIPYGGDRTNTAHVNIPYG
ncbi:hypothetical protein Btru_066278, partial [Bulinus truncatus]